MVPARVLIADDDESIRRLLSMSLRLRGFQVIEARNGKQALTEMRAGHADLVLLDLMMPELSGWEVLRERARHPSLLRIPTIVITATNERTVTADLLNAQVDAIIAKPFDLNDVTARVTASLEHLKAVAPAAA